MKKHAYTIIITLLLAIACLATCSYAEGWSEQANAYEPVIALYKAALSGDEKSQENEDFNASALMCAVTAGVDPMAAVGCNYVDLDLDGTPELIIGETEALEAEGFLFDIWALKGGKPVLAARGWERNLLYLTVDQATGAFGLYQEGVHLQPGHLPKRTGGMAAQAALQRRIHRCLDAGRRGGDRRPRERTAERLAVGHRPHVSVPDGCADVTLISGDKTTTMNPA